MSTFLKEAWGSSKNKSNEAISAETQVQKTEHAAETEVHVTVSAEAGASEAVGAPVPSLEIREQTSNLFPASPTRPSAATLVDMFTPEVSPIQFTHDDEASAGFQDASLEVSLPPRFVSHSGQPSETARSLSFNSSILGSSEVGAAEPQARRVLQFGEAGAARDPKDEEISRLQQELKRSERAVSDMQHQNASLKGGSTQICKMKNLQIEELRRQNVQLTNELATVNAGITEHATEANEVIDAVIDLIDAPQVRVGELTRQIAAQACAYQRQQAEMQVLREQQQHSHAEMERLTSRERALQEEVKTVEGLYHAQTRDWNNLVARNVELRDLSDARNVELERLSGENGQYLQENTALRAQLEALEARNAELQRQVDQSRRQSDSLTQQNDQLRGRNMALQQQVDRLARASTELCDQLAASEQHRADLGADAAHLNRLNTSLVWQHEMQFAQQRPAVRTELRPAWITWGVRPWRLHRLDQWGFLIALWILVWMPLVQYVVTESSKPLDTWIDCTLHPVQCLFSGMDPFSGLPTFGMW